MSAARVRLFLSVACVSSVLADSAGAQRPQLPVALAEVTVELRADSTVLSWRSLAKDGADLPAALLLTAPATVSAIGAGETYDFLWTPDRPMEAILTMGNEAEGFAIRQVLRVR